MMELFAIYQYAFVLCLVAGITLCLQGAHLVARKESLQILALAQAALVGNLVGRLIAPGTIKEISMIFFSFLFFILFKILFIFSKNIRSSKETFFIVTYLALTSISYLLISIFPGLEGHMAIGFFGDIVSLSKNMTFILMGLFCTFIFLFLFFKNHFLKTTFEKSILGIKQVKLLEELLFAFVFVVSLYGLGFLFSVSAMIFPTVLMGTKGKSLNTVLIIMSTVAAISSIVGLAGSILFDRLSTVPTQVLCMLILFIISGLFIGTNKMRKYV